MINRDDLPLYIKGVREKLGLTQMQFAEALSVSFPTVNRWENGRTVPLPLAMKTIQELERNGKAVEPELVAFEEISFDEKYEAIFRGEKIYSIQRERRHGHFLVARYATTNRIADIDQYRKELFHRLQARATKRAKQ